MIPDLIRRLIAIAMTRRLRHVVALIRDLLFGYILLLASAILPLCGWHRVWLKIGWWWWYPTAIAISVVGYFTTQTLLMLALPGLVIADALTLWLLITIKHREP